MANRGGGEKESTKFFESLAGGGPVDKKQKAEELVRKCDGDVGEAAYWHFCMMTDETQSEARRGWGYIGIYERRDAFKATMKLFGPLVRG